MRHMRSPIPRILAAALTVLALTAGCGYSIRPPYTASIKTVYVPIFKGVVFARNLNLQLTELVQKEIADRTPYKVVGSPEGADATLEGTVTMADKNINVENPTNLPRQLQQVIMVSVRFIDNHSKDEKQKDLPPVTVSELAYFFPELGETSQLGSYKAMQKIVEQVVGMMEQPWEGTGLAGDAVKAKP